MTRQEHTERLQQIGQCQDEGERTELIAQLIEDGGADYDSLASVTADRDRLLNENDSLRASNNRLLLRVGTHQGSENPTPNNPNNPNTEKKKFEDLFDEKGGIK